MHLKPDPSDGSSDPKREPNALGSLFGIPVVVLPSFVLVAVFTAITMWAEPQVKRLNPARRGPPFLLRTSDLDLVEAAAAIATTETERERLESLHSRIRVAFGCGIMSLPVMVAMVVVDRLVF